MKEKPYFPLFVDLSNQNILVVGGGKIGGRRAKILCQFCNHVRVVARNVSCPDLWEQKECEVLERGFFEEDISGMNYVVAATNDEKLNDRIGYLCKEKGIPVNVSSNASLCDFYFPGIVMEEDVVVGVTCSGRNHKKVKEYKEKIHECICNDRE